MSKLKIIMFSLFIITLLFIFYLLVNPIYIGEKGANYNFLPNENNLRNHIKYLTSFKKQRSHKNLETLNKVADYIYNSFEKSNCDKVFLQAYKLYGIEYKNIVCRMNAKNNEKIVIGAHYDVYGEYLGEELSEFGEFAGADDNASGVAGLLELVRLAGKNKKKLNNSIEFVAYTLKEQPFFATSGMGSYIHAKSLKEKGEKVKYMISLEMIGYFSDEKIQTYPMKGLNLVYPSKGNFIAVIGMMFDFNISNIKKKMVLNSDIIVKSLSVPIFIDGIDFSDHRNYWLFGYKAYVITDTGAFRNTNYHTEFDTIKTLDFKKMSEVVKGIYAILIGE